MSKIAVIDVGSYTVRALLAQADLDRKTWQPLTYGRRVTHLGRGLDRGQGLDPAAVEATTEAVAELAARARTEGAEVVLPVGTAALRRAAAAGDRAVIEGISRAANAPLRVLSGRDEARLSFGGMRRALGQTTAGWLVFDLGGRSLELAVWPLAGEAVSLDLGALSLTEFFVKGDPPRPDEVAALEARVRSVLAAAGPHPGPGIPDQVAGTGGTVSTLGVLEAGVSEYRPGAVEGVYVSRERVRYWRDLLAGVAGDERRRVLGPAADRAPVIVAGATVVLEVVRRFEAAGVKVVESGLLEGVIDDYLNARG
jgi:exopolyphosphatase/guanosine-5'-triphosphate,3'-diphosphate pyrophosphatase